MGSPEKCPGSGWEPNAAYSRLITMRRRGKVALGGGMVSAAAVGWMVAAGVFATTATLVVSDPLAPPAQAEADALTPFEGCSELLDWYVSHGVKDVGPYGWGGMVYPTDGFVTRDLAGGPVPLAAEGEVPGSATGTNTQEQSVDEPDIAKTNGTLVVRVADGDRAVALVDVSGAEPRTVGTYRLPADGYNAQLLLVGDRVLVTQQVDGGYYGGGFRGGPAIEDRSMPFPYPGNEGSVRVLDLDIADPSDPTLVRKDVYSGTLTSARQYGDTVRLVTTTGRPQLDWVTPTDELTEKEATRRNQALVRATTIEDWLPSVRGDGPSTPLLDCEDVFHPEAWSGAETVAVSTYAMADPGQRNAVGITATGQVVYSSGTRLYVASTEWELAEVRPLDTPSDSDPSGRIAVGPPEVTTHLHAFALEDTATSYVGSGHVDGMLRDRWSLDEHDGRLRVAWSTADRRGRTNNGITVLAERDGVLVPTGTVTDLGRDENIQSVRWFDDLAIMVTFRQIDPLYTIDLTDQDNPRTLGELKIPGFSGYLHPVGDDLLLGLGVDATTTGRSLGAQAAVFDISDLRKPVRVSTAGFGAETALTAIDDPRGFTWLAGSRTGVTPVADWRTGRPTLKALEVSPGGQLRTRTLADLNLDWQSRTLELPGGRIAVLDLDRVRLITID